MTGVQTCALPISQESFFAPLGLITLRYNKMRSSTFVRLSLAIIALLFLSYIFSEKKIPLPLNLDEAFQVASAAVSSLHGRLISKMQTKPSQNLVYSPLSVHLALNLAREGAGSGSRTLREMDSVLGTS